MEYLTNALGSLDFWLTAAEIAAIVLTMWLFFKRFVKNTASEKLVRGLVGLGVMWIASWLLTALGLDILGTFMRWIAMFLSVGLIVIFQPELRKFLGMMGHISFLEGLFSQKAVSEAKNRDMVSRAAGEIAGAAEYMSKKRVGALIVFQNDLGGAIGNAGTIINADITSELLLTIFFPKTSLHDGAVVIKNGRVHSAGAILPLTENTKLHWQYGTRHRAALGMSEVSDAYVLVVSEETGNISIAHNGRIAACDDMKKLRAKLESILSAK
jgi:diadenylate cyclase